MESQLSQLINRLEAVTTRLEACGGRDATDSGHGSQSSDAVKPSVIAYDAIISGSLAQFITASNKIGGDIQTQVSHVKAAFNAQREFLVKASKCKRPSDSALEGLLKPTSESIAAVVEFREKNRKSPLFNHLSALSESIPALGWVAISPTPGPHVKDMTEAGQFYTNRVLKDFKEKDPVHGEWVKAWITTLNELQNYIKQFYATGVEWNKQGCDISQCLSSSLAASAPACRGPPPPPPGPPPPPVLLDMSAAPSGGDSVRSALFADLSKGEDVTKGLKKVTDDMKTHKNPALRVGAGQPIKPTPGPKPGHPPKPGAVKKEQAKPPKCELEGGKKWIVEHQHGNKNIVISETEMKQTIYIYKCEQSTIQVKGKVNAITMDGCKKSAVVFDEAISSLDFVNCQSVQAQILVKVPTISIDKTDGCMVYLSKDSLNSQIVTAKSSEMNILVPDANGEFKEFAIPEQYRTHWNGARMVTEVTEMNFG